jgi:hypothetical protein
MSVSARIVIGFLVVEADMKFGKVPISPRVLPR